MHKKRLRDSLPYFVNREFFIVLLAAAAVTLNVLAIVMKW